LTGQIDRALSSISQRTDTDLVAAAQRLRHISKGLEEAHRIGCRPADSSALSIEDVPREFSRVYSATQTPDLAEAGARWARSISDYMIVRGSPPGIADDWVFIAELLARVAAAYEHNNGGFQQSQTRPGDEASGQIYTLDYRALGAVVTEAFLVKLRRATDSIEQALAVNRQPNPLTADEILLLQGVVAGRSITDLAVDLHYSERSISRTLRSIWERVGATSRAEGIAKITANSWLETPPRPSAGPTSDSPPHVNAAARSQMSS